jgi:anti-sigma B factor antagonist
VEHSLEVTTVEDGEAIVFRLVGDMDIAGAPRLRAAVLEAERDAHSPLVLDMQGVDFVDSSGIATLLELQQTAANCHRVVLINPGSQAVKVLELGGVIKLFDVRTTDSEAR